MGKVYEPEVLVGKAVTSSTADTDFLLLNAEQIRELFDLVVAQNVMSVDSRLINVQAQQQDLGNVDIVDGQMVGGLGATEQMAGADELAPVFAGVSLNPQPFEIRYPFETTRLPRWNVEGAGLEGKMDGIVGKYYFNQLEEVLIHSDTGGANPGGYGTGMLTTVDGWITKALANCHVYDHAGDNVRALLFEEMLNEMPDKWIGSEAERSQFRFYVPSRVERAYKAWLKATRQTALGDMQLTEDGGIAYSGIPVVPVPKMHINDAGVLTQSAVADGLAFCLLCKPDNKLIGFNPEMRVFKHPRDDGKVTYVNLWGEYDCGFLVEDAVVVGANVDPTLDAAVLAEL